MTYNFNVQEPYKSFLLSWEKTVEWRLNKGKFKKFLVWDILEFETGEKFKILRKTEYKTFFEMIKIEWIENVLPDFKDIQDWVENVYYKFYSAEKEREFGILAIEVELIK
jgi:ASC-1-like (ASCH) protein